MTQNNHNFSHSLKARSRNYLIAEEIVASGHVYYAPQHLELVERHTTALIISEQDLLPQNASHLAAIIDHALNYESSFSDIEVLNALSHAPTFVQGNYAVLALYLYLANEVSRCPNSAGITFLGACHDPRANLTQKAGEVMFCQDIGIKLSQALDVLGLYHRNDIKQVVNDWLMYGTFTVNGEINIHRPKSPSNPKFSSAGIYVELVKTICNPKENTYIQISDCVSFAVGIKAIMASYGDNHFAAHDYIKSISSNHELITRIIAEGDAIRKASIHRQINASFPEDISTPDPHHNQFFINLLTGLPESALRILQATNYSIVYSPSKDISPIYVTNKAGILPGFTKDHCEKVRSSKGLNLPRYQRLLVSDGINRDNLTPEQIHLGIQQTILHETLHNAFAAKSVKLDQRMSAKLGSFKDQVLVICKDLQAIDTEQYPAFKQMSHTINYNLHHILNNQPQFTYTDDAWAEEILANIYSLMHTEFTKEKMPEKNPFHSCGRDDEERELAGIRKLSREISEFMQEIARKLSKGHERRLSSR